MTDGGPGQSTLVLSQYIYQKGFEENQFGYASAVSIVLFAICFVVTIVQFLVNKRRSADDRTDARHAALPAVAVPAAPASTVRRAGSGLAVLGYAALVVAAVGLLLPFFWMVVSSLKTNNDVFTVPIKWCPRPSCGSNYVDIWQRVRHDARGCATPCSSSVVVTVPAGAHRQLRRVRLRQGALPRPRRAVPGLHRHDRRAVAVVHDPAVHPACRSCKLSNTLWSIIPLQAFGAFGVFLMKQYYETIPEELSEAARIDGLSEYGIWRRIMLPLSKPALASLALLTFVNTWNDYLGPLIYLRNPDLWTIQLGLRTFIAPVQRRVRADHDRLGAVGAADRDHLPARPAVLRRGHRHQRAEGVTADARIRHETYAAVFDMVYVALDDQPAAACSAACRWSCGLRDDRPGAVLAAARARRAAVRARRCAASSRCSSAYSAERTPPVCCARSAGPGGHRWRRAIALGALRHGRARRARAWTSAPRGGTGRRGRHPGPGDRSMVLAVATALLALVALAERPAARLRDVARACAVPGGPALVPHRGVAARARAARRCCSRPARRSRSASPRAAAVRRLGQQPLHPARRARPIDAGPDHLRPVRPPSVTHDAPCPAPTGPTRRQHP